MIKKNVLGKSKLISGVEDRAEEGQDSFSSLEKVPRNYPDGKQFIVLIDSVRYFAIKINGKVFRTTSLLEA